MAKLLLRLQNSWTCLYAKTGRRSTRCDMTPVMWLQYVKPHGLSRSAVLDTGVRVPVSPQLAPRLENSSVKQLDEDPRTRRGQ